MKQFRLPHEKEKINNLTPSQIYNSMENVSPTSEYEAVRTMQAISCVKAKCVDVLYIALNERSR